MSRSFGGVIVSGGGKILLREPSNHFGGLVWTFCKTESQPGESPEETALRAVREKTGYEAAILLRLGGQFQGSVEPSDYFLMEARKLLSEPNWQTSAICWTPALQAPEMIKLSPNQVSRNRDLTVLELALTAAKSIPFADHPRVHAVDWPDLKSMPQRHVVLHPTIQYSRIEMEKVVRGFVVYDMDAKWFIYFDGTRLKLHRSWTGFIIFDVGFRFYPDGSATVTDVVVNRAPNEYLSNDDDGDVRLLKDMISCHLLEPTGWA